MKIIKKLKKATLSNVLIKANLLVSKKAFHSFPEGQKRAIGFYWAQTENEYIRLFNRKYQKQIIQFKKEIDAAHAYVSHSHPKIIWVCWLQGFDNAPDIVKACRRSLNKNIPSNYSIIEINEENWIEYCSLPPYIIEKYKKGIITKTLFSDLIRINLLNRYGGTWVDATILCTGTLPEYMLKSNLFLPQSVYLETLTTAFRIDSFFITACQNNKILLLTEKLLHLFLGKNTLDTMSYHITYEMFEIAIINYKDEWRNVTPFSRSNTHIIEERLYSTFKKEDFEEFQRISPFHKLSYKKHPDYDLFLTDVCDGESYYDYIIKNF